MRFAEDPRAFRAWRKGWDPDHWIRLRRWQAGGFRPKIVYDIGAYQGGWAEMCHAIFSPAQCFLFEPQPENQSRLKARQPPGAHWELMPVALGDVEQIQPLYRTQNNSASSILPPIEGAVPGAWGTKCVERMDVRVVTLDKLAETRALPPPDLVKIDVQGYEGRVISGGRNVLPTAQRIVVEASLHPIYKDQSLLPEVAATLSSWGFDIEDITEACREWDGRLSQVDLWCRRAA
ncbi:MAG: FkbM family methyltransferase [Verrucomicrobia bacterium]|nr:FkbM family methyltransferase [Verrucomicrobiota bacterium]